MQRIHTNTKMEQSPIGAAETIIDAHCRECLLPIELIDMLSTFLLVGILRISRSCYVISDKVLPGQDMITFQVPTSSHAGLGLFLKYMHLTLMTISISIPAPQLSHLIVPSLSRPGGSRYL